MSHASIKLYVNRGARGVKKDHRYQRKTAVLYLVANA